jgi:3-oxoadipate enol-lactonase / 4-carboxymuconolactone decarboxylase
MRLHHVVDGPPDARVVVLGSSLGTTHEMWAPQVPVLARHFRVVRYDRRGHGRSPLPDGPTTLDDLGADIVELVDTLGAERVSFVGLSLGGLEGMWLALNAPDRVDRLALCCTTASFRPREGWIERATLVRSKGMAAIAEAVLGRWFRPRFHADRPEEVERYRSMLLSTPPEGYAACCDTLADADLTSRVGAITAPTLVLTGADDPAVPPDVGAALAASIPGADHVVVDDAAHMANVEQPEAFTAALLAHLDGSDDARKRGMTVRRAVLGDAHVDRAVERTTPFTADFQDFITRYAWGEIWSRPGLDRRTRSCVTLTALVALGRDHELALHVRAALRNGLTPDEIGEVLLQCAVYCGVPAANAAFAIAQEVLAEERL